MLTMLKCWTTHVFFLFNYNEHPTYAGLVKVIGITISEVDPNATNMAGEASFKHHTMFSAQNDDWEMSYTKRTGLPLNLFAKRYQLLKAAGERPSPPGGEHRFGPGRVLSYDQILSKIRKEAVGYLKSYPGLDNRGLNTSLHRTTPWNP